MSAVSLVIGAVAALLGAYSAWILAHYSRARQKGTIRRTSSTSARRVRKDDFLLSLIATYEPKIKALLDPPPDEVVVAVSKLPEEQVPRGMVIASTGNRSKKETIPLLGESPVRPLFEAILKMRLDGGSESVAFADEKEVHVA